MNSLFLILALTQADAATTDQDDSYLRRPEEIASGEARRARWQGVSTIFYYGGYRRADDGVSHFWFYSPTPGYQPGGAPRWTTTLDCPGARQGLVALADLAMPEPRLPMLDDERPRVVADGGWYYRIKIPANYANGESARITLENWLSGPAGDWVDSMLETLEPCWTGTRPRRPE